MNIPKIKMDFLFDFHQLKMSMFQRAYQADPPIYAVNFKLHYKVKQGEAVYISINGRTHRMTYGHDQHGDIWTLTQTFSPSYGSHYENYQYYYFVAKFDYQRNITHTICYENSEEVMQRFINIFWSDNLYVQDWCHDRNKNTVWNQYGKIVN